MRGPSNSTRASLAITLSVTSLSVSYWLSRRLRRRYNQSQALRKVRRARVDAETLEVGSYVRLRGVVNSGSRQLTSPMKGMPCVRYRVMTVRVVDSRMSQKKTSASGIWGLGGVLKAMIPWLFSFITSTEVSSEKWDTVYQKISSREESVEVYLEEDHAGVATDRDDEREGERRARVRLDLAGAEFFKLEEVESEFKPDKPTGGSTRTQLGYRTTEEVLAIGARVTILGEVSEDNEGTGQDLVISRASPYSMLDLKTASISRPFVVSCKSEQALLQEIERSGRVYLLMAIPTLTIGLAFAYLGTKFVLAAMEEGNAPPEAAGKDSKQPSGRTRHKGTSFVRRLL